MDGLLYPASLVLLALLAFTFNQNNNTKMTLIMILIGIYIVYSHETGDSATNWKNNMLDSLGESTKDFATSHTKNIDESK